MMMLFLFLKEEGGRIYLIYYLKKERGIIERVNVVVVLLNLELNFTLKW